MTLDQIRVLKNRVLVLLPASEAEATTASGLFVAHTFTPPAAYGRVLKVGPDVREVQPGDMVAFPPTVGDLLPFTDTAQGLFLRESEISAVIPRKDVAA